MKKGVNVYLDEELYNQVAKVAKSKGVSMSTWFRLLAMQEVGVQPQPKPSVLSLGDNRPTECPKCGTSVDDRDEFNQQVFCAFDAGIWRCTECGGEGKWS
ncbi:MAG: hypothetical protein QMD71_06355 [bacterium]|nr:hypothetical protein [bacterium]